jgi:putative DNA primase/helicase
MAANPPHVVNFLSRLEKVKATSNGWQARCPAHEDRDPSLSIAVGEDGRILLRCHAGCSTEAIVAAIGLEMRDLFPDDVRATPSASKATPKRMVATYPYHGEDGQLLYEVVRYEPKDFRQRRPDGEGGWNWSLNGTPRVPYRLLELLSADSDAWVFVCEGEKDVDALAALGLLATCNPGGASKWKHLADDSALHGRRVAIIPDADEPGRKHAQDVAARLDGKTVDVRIVDLAEIEDFTGKDVSDWLDSLNSKEPADLAQALMGMAESAEPWTEEASSRALVTPQGPSPVLLNMADVKAERVKWLWPSRVALGKLTVIAGDPGLGKSFLTLDMAARVSTASPWPGESDNHAEPGGVVLLSAEDDPADTIRPRLDAAHADVRRIALLQAIQHSSANGIQQSRAFNLGKDLDALEQAMASVAPCRLVVVDPISAYLGKADSYRDAEVRAVLAPLSDLAARRGVAVVVVTHLRKGDGAAIYRTMGSVGIVAAARAAYVVARDPQDESGARCLVLPVKSNLSRDRDGLAYRLESDGGETPHVSWEEEPVRILADDVLSVPARPRGPAPEGKDAAAEWLLVELADGPCPSQSLFMAAHEEGISKRTLQRAKSALGIHARKTGFDGHWIWELPEEGHTEPQEDNLTPLEETGALQVNCGGRPGAVVLERPSPEEGRQESQVSRDRIG